MEEPRLPFRPPPAPPAPVAVSRGPHRLLGPVLVYADQVNRRERIFGQAVTSYDHLRDCVPVLQPFVLMWKSISDFHMLHPRYMEGPLVEVQVPQVQANLEAWRGDAVKFHEAMHPYPAVRGVVDQWEHEVPCQCLCASMSSKVQDGS